MEADGWAIFVSMKAEYKLCSISIVHNFVVAVLYLE